jgi:hypothetical protein
VTPNPYYPGNPERDYPDYERRQAKVRITRVWTDDVSADQVTVHWTTDRPTIGTVEWGTDDFTERTDWPSAADTYHTVVLSDLEPGTEYRYRVLVRAPGGAAIWSPEMRVRTTD